MKMEDVLVMGAVAYVAYLAFNRPTPVANVVMSTSSAIAQAGAVAAGAGGPVPVPTTGGVANPHPMSPAGTDPFYDAHLVLMENNGIDMNPILGSNYIPESIR